jgi:hypothetical protein
MYLNWIKSGERIIQDGVYKEYDGLRNRTYTIWREIKADSHELTNMYQTLGDWMENEWLDQGALDKCTFDSMIFYETVYEFIHNKMIELNDDSDDEWMEECCDDFVRCCDNIFFYISEIRTN